MSAGRDVVRGHLHSLVVWKTCKSQRMRSHAVHLHTTWESDNQISDMEHTLDENMPN